MHPPRPSASRNPAVWRTVLAATGCLLLLQLAPSSSAQDAASEGLFISVPSPITSEVKERIKEVSARAADRNRQAAERKPLKIIYDFNPANNGPSSSEDFGACYELAKYLQQNLPDVTTVAFLHGKVTRHSVLPVLACREIIMSSEARIGDVIADAARGDMDVERGVYLKVVKDRRCPAVVLKMLEPNLVLLPAKKLNDGSRWFIAAGTEDEERRVNHAVPVAGQPPVIGSGPGTTLLTATQAHDLGLCQAILEDPQAVAQAYDLPAGSLRGDPLVGQRPVAWRFEVRGAITTASAEALKRRIRRAIAHQANLLILELDCAGGEPDAARDLAEFLRKPTAEGGDAAPVLTVAYIPDKAPDTAVFLALGCTEIVMHKGNGKEAEIGDFSGLFAARNEGGRPDAGREGMIKAVRESLVQLAKERGYPSILADGMLNRELTINEVVARKGPREWRLISGREFDDDQALPDPHWRLVRQIKPGGPNGTWLTLKADDAVQLHLAQRTVDGLPGLYERYGIEEGRVRTPRADWMDQMADFLTNPLTRVFLFMIGFICLFLELKMPGVGLPGVIAAVCFILFFWSHSLAGQFTMLAVLLFMLGLVLVGLEVFVLPGLGVAGVSGTILIILSMALVTLEKKPETHEEWMDFGSTITSFGMGLVGAVVVAATLAWYLPSIPYFNRIVLKPAGEDIEDEADRTSDAPPLAALLGAIGVAITPLRPAGKVKFGDEYIDVVAEGSYVQPNTRVQVIEVEANRVVVKEV